MNETDANPPYWHQLTLHCSDPIPEAISAHLFELGASGIEEQETSSVVYYPGHIDINRVEQTIRATIAWLQKELGLTVSIRLSRRRIENENWHENWQQYFAPVAIGSRLLIMPSWSKQVPAVDQIPIIIDPQQAFGTGGHETTQLMLAELIHAVQPGMSVLDAGTGSGILAIAAAKLGAKQIYAFDHDAIAIATAAENARQNGEADKIQFVISDKAPKGSQQEPFDLLLANMLSRNLLVILPGLAELLYAPCHLFFSGLLIQEREMFVAALAAARIAVVDEKSSGEWLCLHCTSEVRA